MAKKKGSRYTPPKAKLDLCKVRSAHARRPMEHKYTSRQRKKLKGTDEWSPWTWHCSWCTKEKP